MPAKSYIGYGMPTSMGIDELENEYLRLGLCGKSVEPHLRPGHASGNDATSHDRNAKSGIEAIRHPPEEDAAQT